MPTVRPPIFRTAPAFADDRVVDVPPFGECRRVDIWDAWAYAQAEVEVAFRAWATSTGAERRDQHVVYRAALEREERAALVLAAVAGAEAPRRQAAALTAVDRTAGPASWSMPSATTA
jgi:hypothetical protein